jgi:hypothetical protein
MKLRYTKHIQLLFCCLGTMSRVVRPQVLNAAFLAASNDFKQKLPHLTHDQKVGIVDID